MNLHTITRAMRRAANAQDAYDRRLPPEPDSHPDWTEASADRGEVACDACDRGLVEVDDAPERVYRTTCPECEGSGIALDVRDLQKLVPGSARHRLSLTVTRHGRDLVLDVDDASHASVRAWDGDHEIATHVEGVGVDEAVEQWLSRASPEARRAA